MEKRRIKAEWVEWEVKEEATVEEFLNTQGFSKNLTREAYRKGLLFLDDITIRKNKDVYPGDMMRYRIPEEVHAYVPEAVPLEIILEDEDYLIINKPPYLPMMPEKGKEKGGLINRVAYDFETKNLHRKIRFVNRLDRDTSGIVVVAKHAYAQGRVMQQMEEGSVKKVYLAVVKGKIPKEGSISMCLSRGKEEPRTIPSEVGKEAYTEWRVLEENNGFVLLSLFPDTGRTHQLRAHLSGIGSPIVGDALYGGSDIFPRQALHAWKYTFQNVSGKSITCIASLPKDMRDLLSRMNLCLH